MISHPAFSTDPWAIREVGFTPDVLAQSESVFALSNGHIGIRGNLDEGEPHGLPGTYLNGVYENRPLPYAEAGYGDPDSGQTVINVTNGKIIRLLVDDEPFDVRYGTLLSHTRDLDMRAGTLRREVRWVSPAGKEILVRSTRLVSLTHRSIVAIRYEVEAIDPVAVVIQSELVANESLPKGNGDPRSSSPVEWALTLEESTSRHSMALMVHRTLSSGLLVGAAMDHEIDGPDGCRSESEAVGDVARVTVVTHLEAGQKVRLVKLISYGWSGVRSRPAVHDQVVAALAGARQAGWDGLVSSQRAFLDGYWSGADIEVEGDPQVQQAVRFGLFHIIQASARGEQRPVPAKGLTGPGYDGHTFWDSETYVLPVLTYTYPLAARDALLWRASTLPIAEQRAQKLGLRGAAFPWRTIDGKESSGYWPAGTAAFHINADIADAVIRYLDATGDPTFEAETALPLLVGTARLWRSLGQHDIDGNFRIDGVTGPDEYSAIADNNVYTNLMAQRNLRAGAEVASQHHRAAESLRVSSEETASWRDAADTVVIPYDDRLGVHAQSEGFTDHAPWDFEATPSEHYPLMLHYPYFDLYRKQVCKQVDLVLAMVICGESFTADEKTRNFDYYEAVTVRDSSLSASMQAVMAAEVGHLDLAHDYLGEACLIDLRDLEHNTSDGLHLASLAGAWTALVTGFGGLRAANGIMHFSPRLPSGITSLRFKLRYRGSRIGVDITSTKAVYRLLEGSALRIGHHGELIDMAETPVERAIPPLGRRPRPRQPAGREPAPHHTRIGPKPVGGRRGPTG
ncbi:MAG: glycoside hydrolase family 65 protein [Acidobacteriota bacterium]|nr:glycoside hydrolase family 65 protein [Acidobacteriota bacterium]